jgi:hypothetical protein
MQEAQKKRQEKEMGGKRLDRGVRPEEGGQEQEAKGKNIHALQLFGHENTFMKPISSFSPDHYTPSGSHQLPCGESSVQAPLTTS